jgi:hypothetical protein
MKFENEEFSARLRPLFPSEAITAFPREHLADFTRSMATVPQRRQYGSRERHQP